MGKNLIQQARGTGSPTYRSPSHRFRGSIQHARKSDILIRGEIVDLMHCPGHSAPLAFIRYENGEETLAPAAEGIRVGDEVTVGAGAEPQPMSVLPLKDIPEGTQIHNIENQPGDGGKFVRSSGAAARIIAKLPSGVVVLLPSKRQKTFPPECRASVGVIAGGGRTEKPLVKAGKRYHKMRARNKLYPLVSGASMNAVDHPLGGTRSSRKGRPTISPKNAPPGRKVGMIRPRRTGRRKGKA
ncbi:50S ribosomal protein L2 [Candidatus Woesearchaeota archaeon]|nr:50S ribosomal protein L2 [Candidatus Woesearchaeota archaeon]